MVSHFNSESEIAQDRSDSAVFRFCYFKDKIYSFLQPLLPMMSNHSIKLMTGGNSVSDKVSLPYTYNQSEAYVITLESWNNLFSIITSGFVDSINLTLDLRSPPSLHNDCSHEEACGWQMHHIFTRMTSSWSAC